MVKAHKEAVEKFEGRIQQMASMLVRLLQQLSAGTTEPEQLKDFKSLLEDAHAAIEVV